MTTPTPTLSPPIEAALGNYDEIDNEGEGDDDLYDAYFQSIRSPTGLEIGVKVMWPSLMDKDEELPMELSTCLPEDEIAPNCWLFPSSKNLMGNSHW
jgi:hypothetical protein